MIAPQSRRRPWRPQRHRTHAPRSDGGRCGVPAGLRGCTQLDRSRRAQIRMEPGWGRHRPEDCTRGAGLVRRSQGRWPRPPVHPAWPSLRPARSRTHSRSGGTGQPLSPGPVPHIRRCAGPIQSSRRPLSFTTSKQLLGETWWSVSIGSGALDQFHHGSTPKAPAHQTGASPPREPDGHAHPDHHPDRGGQSIASHPRCDRAVRRS